MKGVKLTPSNKHVNDLRRRGYQVVVGVDEVGRGALAGPVVAAAVLLPPRQKLVGVHDSKQLTLSQRLQISKMIRRQARAVGIGWATAQEVDNDGLTKAVCYSGQRALQNLGTDFNAVLLDGNHNYLKGYCYSEAVIKADALSLTVAAASIIAKVARDNYMRLMHSLYPEFGFDSNVGYGTGRHLRALRQGISPIHRRRFAPVAQMTAVEAGAFLEMLEHGDVD